MSSVSMLRYTALVVLSLSGTSAYAQTAANPGNAAAHALAQRFSDAATEDAKHKTEAEAKQKEVEAAKKKADEDAAKKRVDELKRIAQEKAEEARRKAEEAEMLAHAAAEAREREAANKKAEEQRLTAERERAAADEEANKRDATLKAETERLVREAEEARRAEEEHLAAEERKEKENAKPAVQLSTSETAPGSNPSNKGKPSSFSDPLSSPPGLQPEDQNQLQADREDEIERLAEKLKKVREGLPNPDMGLGGEPYRPRPLTPVTLPGQDSAEAKTISRVSVLLVMKPGDKGIRKFNKTADPVLCLGSVCYVGSGSDKPAERMSRGEVLGPVNTLGARAGACRQSLTCVFRNIELPDGIVEMQPIDLRYLRHDRRQAVPVLSDPSCKAENGELSCTHPISGDSWQAWIVPEDVAKMAGASLLEAALKNGLKNNEATALRDPMER